ncbi:hypothetical protein CCC_03353 [Paramagnetospirillum magnetotacticum MS-1]|uniref:Uncharacterized protein n=1 Tax=Paramagnetospirillum magnetotacticum MS-1 TaxID=272627 RepID=A0A0C2YWU1_PARME|nr:hypothetical protein CCC_03353 [Paramagnetospirillum magnetotacticum MS-1]
MPAVTPPHGRKPLFNIEEIFNWNHENDNRAEAPFIKR